MSETLKEKEMFKTYDTIAIRSPFLTEEIASIIENECILRQGVDVKTGELLYQITTGSLEGSYDSRISIKVERSMWFKNLEDKVPFRKTTPPYLYVEGSVHKAMVGHNVWGGPTDFIKSVKFFLKLIEELIQLKLPTYEKWEVRRVDVSEIYVMPSFEHCVEWFRGINNSVYARRSVDRYGLHGLYSRGSTTALKFYHKGVEFAKHDRKRLKRFLTNDKVDKLQEFANLIIRCECEIKTRKLIYDFGSAPLVGQVTDDYLNRVHDAEVKRLLNEGKQGYELVRGASEVKERLYSVYSNKLAGTLLGTWYAFSTLGESSMKSTLTKATFYRHRKLLKDVGIAWKGTDVVLRKNQFDLILQDFAPVRQDVRRYTNICPEVLEHLLSIA